MSLPVIGGLFGGPVGAGVAAGAALTIPKFLASKTGQEMAKGNLKHQKTLARLLQKEYGISAAAARSAAISATDD